MLNLSNKPTVKALSIVRSSQGSWRWQTPYIVKEYEAKKLKNGSIYYKFKSNLSRKLTYERALALALNLSGSTPVFAGGLNNIQPWQISIQNNLNRGANRG